MKRNKTIKVTIDDKEIKLKEGATILEAALQNNIYIPHLCYCPDLKPVGACRLCMVEISGKGLMTSCNTPVEKGMAIKTESPEISKIRRTAVELFIVNHHADCLSCVKNTQCKLQDIATYIGVEEGRLKRLRATTKTIPIDTSNPFFDREPDRCVLCGICVRTCEEIQGVSAIDFAFRGYDTTISTFGNKPLLESRCESCGECVVRCPVGALRPKAYQKPSREVKSVCTYCGVGCGIYLGVRGNSIVSVRGNTDSPANEGRLCVKGRFGYDFINHPDRLRTPLIKKNGKFSEATWEEALELIAKKFSLYKKEQFAAIASARCTNEENYLVQKFTRAVMGTNNVDHCARLCHAPTVAGLAQSLGSGAMTNTINEIGNAACIFAIGTNTTSAHPVIGLQVRKAAKNSAKLIVANPKEIDLCRFADVFIRHRPGTDVALLMGMMRVILDEGLCDLAFIEKRTEGFEDFKKAVSNFSMDFVEKTTGVERKTIIEAARIYATTKPSTILYAMGICQHSHGTDNVMALSNLALITGNIGKPSAGVNPLRGQNNVQGACDMGSLPNVYPGYQKVDDHEVRRKFESAWGVPLDPSRGLTHFEISDAAYDKKIKALYLVGENPVLSEANARHLEDALKRLEFFVVQDIFLTETAELADVVLPAASFAEKDGTFTNSERRVQRIYKAIEPVGDARPDWWITCQIVKKLGGKGFDFSNPGEIMDEIASLVPSYKGISYDRLEKGALQWPCLDHKHKGTQILHTERFATKSGKAKFISLEYRPSQEIPDSEYPLLLTTESSLYHYTSASMTRRVKGLNILREHELVEINPEDAAKLGISDGETVRVTSRRGEAQAKAKVTDVPPPGVISMSIHFAETKTNLLTNPSLDPMSKTPETKVCAVKVSPVRS
ncbi:formate dehydrogenase subunit alpha [Candidatus Omnitrophota bacterium]